MLLSLLTVLAAAGFVANEAAEEAGAHVLARVDAAALAEAEVDSDAEEDIDADAEEDDEAPLPEWYSGDAEEGSLEAGSDGSSDDDDRNTPAWTQNEASPEVAPTDRMCCCDATEPQKYLCLKPGEVGSKVLTPVDLKARKKGRNDPVGSSLDALTRTMKVTRHVHGECNTDGSATTYSTAKDLSDDIQENQWELKGSRWATYTSPKIVKKRYTNKEPLLIVDDDVVYRPVGDNDLRGRKSEMKEDFGEGLPYCVRWVEVPQVTIKSKKRTSRGKITVASGAPSNSTGPAVMWGKVRNDLGALRNSSGGAPQWLNQALAAQSPWKAKTKCEMIRTCIEWAFGSSCGFDKLEGTLYKRVGRKGKCEVPLEGKKECPRKQSYFRGQGGWFGKGGWKFCDCTASAGLSATSVPKDFKKAKCVV